MERKANGFTVNNWKNLKPIEDAYNAFPNGRLICVADGITRDPCEMQILPLRKDLIGMARFFMRYPKESPAFEVAKVFGNFFEILGGFPLGDASPERVRRSFESANTEIRNFNEKYLKDKHWREFDYLEHDIPGCTAAGAVISDNNVTYGFIADCGLAIFDKDGNMRFRTKNEGPNSKGSIDEDVKRKYKTDFRHSEGRRIIRRDYRNNPSNPLSYGALTGESRAMDYVRTGQESLAPREIVVAYTDGLEEAVFSEDFAKRIMWGDFDAIKNLCKRHVRTEGTLVYSVEERR